MPTIKDIAARAGVSHGAVSNVLNKRGNVSAEKIQLVEQAARELATSSMPRPSSCGQANLYAGMYGSRHCDGYGPLYAGGVSDRRSGPGWELR